MLDGFAEGEDMLGRPLQLTIASASVKTVCLGCEDQMLRIHSSDGELLGWTLYFPQFSSSPVFGTSDQEEAMIGSTRTQNTSACLDIRRSMVYRNSHLRLDYCVEAQHGILPVA
ncbi:hypothetical protein VTL71DRAFT_10563 [Oculimacula yallundae]|uniref:Uncharacterized protein n=1 Tax=Oculimacula yallundae TaxID=86028 RepID=A0ABR4CTC9_9HELO